MWPLDPVKTKYPRTWADHSLEYKCAFAFFLCMMFMPLLSRQVSALFELLIAGVLVLVFIALSIRHRQTFGWRWAGVSKSDILMAAFSVCGLVFFMYYTQPPSSFGPFSPTFLPFELCVMAMGSFFVLQQLKLVDYSESAFRESCGRVPGEIASTDSAAEPRETTWKRLVRGTYTIAFLLFWVAGVSRPAFLIGLPQMTMVVTFAFLFIGGFVIHFVLGIPLLPNYPTLQELRERAPWKRWR